MFHQLRVFKQQLHYPLRPLWFQVFRFRRLSLVLSIIIYAHHQASNQFINIHINISTSQQRWVSQFPLLEPALFQPITPRPHMEASSQLAQVNLNLLVILAIQVQPLTQQAEQQPTRRPIKLDFTKLEQHFPPPTNHLHLQLPLSLHRRQMSSTQV